MAELTKQEIKKMDAQELGEELVYQAVWGNEEDRSNLLKQLGTMLRNIENTIYWATSDSGYSEEQKKALIDVERERLLDLAYALNPDDEEL